MEDSQPSDADELDQQRVTEPPLLPSYLRSAAQLQARDAQADTALPEKSWPAQILSAEGPVDVAAEDPSCDEVSDSVWLKMGMDDEDTAAALPDAQLSPSCAPVERMQQAGAAQPEGDSVRQRPHVPALKQRRCQFVLHDEDEQPSNPTTAVPSGAVHIWVTLSPFAVLSSSQIYSMCTGEEEDDIIESPPSLPDMQMSGDPPAQHEDTMQRSVAIQEEAPTCSR